MTDDPSRRVRSAVEALVRRSGPLGLGWRASGIDELAGEVVRVCDRVSDIERIADAADPDTSAAEVRRTAEHVGARIDATAPRALGERPAGGVPDLSNNAGHARPGVSPPAP